MQWKFFKNKKMFIKNKKPIKIIGYPQSSMTQEYIEVFSKEKLENFSIVLPEEFILLQNKNQFQYIIAFSLDMDLRERICRLIDDLNLDCMTYINDQAYIFSSSKIKKGCYIGHQVIISWNCLVESHCYFAFKSSFGHDSKIGRNCIIGPSVDIAGKTIIGNNCTFGLRSSVINNISISNNVILGAFSNATKDITKPGKYVGTIARYVGE